MSSTPPASGVDRDADCGLDAFVASPVQRERRPADYPHAHDLRGGGVLIYSAAALPVPTGAPSRPNWIRAPDRRPRRRGVRGRVHR